MRPLLVALLTVPLAFAAAEPEAKPAADAAQEAKAQAVSEAKPVTEAKPAAEEATPPTADAPEGWMSGTVEIGNRWIGVPKGNFAAYRSVVDLGEGPRLTGLDLTFQDPSKRLFERLDIRGNGWGGDPFTTARIDARKSTLYNLSVDYRKFNYFNFLPSFANPFRDVGVQLNQHSFDTNRRFTDVYLELLPSGRVIPYLQFTKDSGFGRGITTYVGGGNEYPVGTTFRDHTENYRGGVRFDFTKLHFTLEQGGTTFKDDQRVFTNDRNLGNRTGTLLGQQLFLTGLNQPYGIRGNSVYSRVLASASPVSWVNLTGSFLFAQPQTDSRYASIAGGNFASLSTLLLYVGDREALTAEAKQPRTSGMFTAEVKLAPRLRLLGSTMTDRLRTSGAGLFTEQFILGVGAGVRDFNIPLFGQLNRNYNRTQTEAILDLTRWMTLRGGYRFVSGSANYTGSPLQTGGIAGAFTGGELKQHLGLGGITIRPGQRLWFNTDVEGGSATGNYFRTSLYNYQRFRGRARYQVLTNLQLNALFTVLNNHNPTRDINYRFRSRENSLSLNWLPQGGKRVTLLAEYTRSTLKSDIFYRVPQDLSLERNLYRDDAHIGTAMVDLVLPGQGLFQPRLAFGGSYFKSGGSRPTDYYQPMLRVHAPVHRNVEWMAEWRYYGFNEAFYRYEAFRAHTVLAGVRIVQ